MNHRPHTLVFVLSAVALLCAAPTGCSDAADGFMMVSYNVQNLFDDHDDGSEYAEYSSAAGWTADAYFSRLQRLADVLTIFGDDLPEVIVMQEIEGRAVLGDLLRDHLRGSNHVALAAPAPGSATTVGVLSAVPVVSVRTHRTVMVDLSGAERGVDRVGSGELAPADRPVLEVELLVDSQPIVCFCVHWKSQSGGERETEPQRLLQAALTREIIAQRRREARSRPCIVVGDFNEDVFEYEMHTPRYQTALLSAAHIADVPAPQRSLVYTEHAIAAESGGGDAPLYSPWPATASPGTYFFRGAWERLDQVFVTPDLADHAGLELRAFGVIDEGPHVDADGFPIRWEQHRDRGYSDHLPIYARFSSVGDER